MYWIVIFKYFATTQMIREYSKLWIQFRQIQKKIIMEDHIKNPDEHFYLFFIISILHVKHKIRKIGHKNGKNLKD